MNRYEVPIDTPADNPQIWRYMDFSKYVDLVTTGELHFARADKLEDPYDCSPMQFFGEAYKQISRANPYGEEHTRERNASERSFVYVNCWHMNDVQSAALWRLYSENKHETIAIQSTFEKLDSETKLKWHRDGIFISKVRYDPENAGEAVEGYPDARLFSASGMEDIIYKRQSFAHERELRAFIYQRFDKAMRNVPVKSEKVQELLAEGRREYIRIPVNVSNLVERVYVSPSAKDLFVDLVKNISRELKDRVQKSDLYKLY